MLSGWRRLLPSATVETGGACLDAGPERRLHFQRAVGTEVVVSVVP